MMRSFRSLLTAGAMAVAATGSMLAVATPAAAATCTNNGPFSFKREVMETYSTIYAYRGANCPGNYISFGRTTLIDGGNIRMYAYDRACDNTGLTVKTASGLSLASTGCGTTAQRTVSRSSTGSYFYVSVGGYLSATNPIPA
ncbi:hypothetical protein [Kibdelosporangium aridum]